MGALFQFAGRTLDLTSPQVMGVLNATPDSFSDGGQYVTHDAALRRASEMVRQGAAIIDVGGESTRPGANKVSIQEEVDRVCPVVEKIISNLNVVVSVDTSTPLLMTECIKLGVGLVNDVRAFTREGALDAVKGSSVALCIMHMQGHPGTMQAKPEYQSVIDEVLDFLLDRVQVLEKVGVNRSRLILDPGFGFGKTLQHNMQLLNNIRLFNELACPVLVGLSRKSMFQEILNKPVKERLVGGLAAATIAAYQGAKIIRTHDVKETVDAMLVISALNESLVI